MIKKIVLIVLSILFIITGCIVGVKYYSEYLVGYTDVYVASHNIAQRSLIDDEDLQKIRLPKDYLDDVYIDEKDIIGKYVKLSYSIPKGSLIYKGYLETDIKDLAHTLLNKNEVNYDLYTNDIKINTANLAKNMYIDLYLTINNKDKPIADLLISNARITGLYDNNNKVINDYDNDSRVYIISIAIDKEYVNYINKANVLGNISCVVNYNTYENDLKCSLNTDGAVFEYLK